MRTEGARRQRGEFIARSRHMVLGRVGGFLVSGPKASAHQPGSFFFSPKEFFKKIYLCFHDFSKIYSGSKN
jgi:hypothetical protein